MRGLAQGGSEPLIETIRQRDTLWIVGSTDVVVADGLCPDKGGGASDLYRATPSLRLLPESCDFKSCLASQKLVLFQLITKRCSPSKHSGIAVSYRCHLNGARSC
jgi:hypothetical protein